MNGRYMTVMAVVFLAATIGFAGAFAYEYSANSGVSGKYSSLQNSFSALNSNYDNQQGSVVLKDAFSHWDDIAIENLTLVSSQYLGNATLHWIGGPLTGNYTGISAINSTWTKFFNLWSAVWFYSESPPSIMIQGNNAYVNSTIQFIVQNASNSSQFKYINVTYTTHYFTQGFNTKTGQMAYEIVYEKFDNTAEGPISKV